MYEHHIPFHLSVNSAILPHVEPSTRPTDTILPSCSELLFQHFGGPFIPAPLSQPILHIQHPRPIENMRCWLDHLPNFLPVDCPILLIRILVSSSRWPIQLRAPYAVPVSDIVVSGDASTTYFAAKARLVRFARYPEDVKRVESEVLIAVMGPSECSGGRVYSVYERAAYTMMRQRPV